MLPCTHCGYDLTSLIKGPDAVLCPECGARTRHDSGRPLQPASAWNSIGPRKWLYIWPAGLTSLLVGITTAMFMPRGLGDGAIVTAFATTALVWAGSILAARRDRDLQPFPRSERRAFVTTVAILAAVGVPVVWAIALLVVVLGTMLLRGL